MQHPDITSALRTGHPTGYSGNEDTAEMREEFITADLDEFFSWVKREHLELLDEFIEDNAREYSSWLD